MADMVVDKDSHSHILEQAGTLQVVLQQNHLKMEVQKIQVSQTQIQVFQTQIQVFQTQGLQIQIQVFQIQKVFSCLLA